MQWKVYAVDDGCPHQSGRIGLEMFETSPLREAAQVLFLEDGIREGIGPLERLCSVDDSRKGGAIIYGCLHALEEGADAIIYTEA